MLQLRHVWFYRNRQNQQLVYYYPVKTTNWCIMGLKTCQKQLNLFPNQFENSSFVGSDHRSQSSLHLCFNDFLTTSLVYRLFFFFILIALLVDFDQSQPRAQEVQLWSHKTAHQPQKQNVHFLPHVPSTAIITRHLFYVTCHCLEPYRRLADNTPCLTKWPAV